MPPRGNLELWRGSAPTVSVRIRQDKELINFTGRTIAAWTVDSGGQKATSLVWTASGYVGQVVIPPAVTATPGVIPVAFIETDGATAQEVWIGILDLRISSAAPTT